MVEIRLKVFPHSRLRVFAAIGLILLSAAPARPGSLAWERVKGVEGGHIRMLGSRGDTVVAMTYQGDVYKSPNAGRSWSLWHRSQGRTEDWLHFPLDPVLIGEGLVGVSLGGSLLVIKGGRSGIVNPAPPGSSIVSKSLIRVGDTLLIIHDGIQLSADSGSTWSRGGRNPGGAWPIAMAHAGGVLLAATTHNPVGNRIHASGDLGITWKMVADSMPVSGDVDGLLATGDGALAWWSDGTLLRLRPSGASWVSTAGKIPVTGPVALFSRPGGVWCLSASGLHLSRDGGATWSQRTTSSPGTAQTLAVLPGGDILAGTHQGVFAWDSLARSWNPRQSGLRAVEVGALVRRGSELVAMGLGGTGLYRSRDRGTTWRSIPLPSGADHVWKLFHLEPDIYVQTDTGHFHALLPSDSLGDNIRHEFPSAKLLEVVRAGNNWLAWGWIDEWPMVSNDGRKTWRPVSTMPWYAGRALLSGNGAQMGFLHADSLHYSSDSGITWKTARSPLASDYLPVLTPTDRSWFITLRAQFRSGDPSQGWQLLASGAATGPFRGILGKDADLHAVTTAEYLHSTDGGATWESRHTELTPGEFASMQTNATTWFTKTMDGDWWVAGVEEAPAVRLQPQGPAGATGLIRVRSAVAREGRLQLDLRLSEPARVRILAYSAKGARLAPPVSLDLRAGSHLHQLRIPAGSALWRLEAVSGRKRATLTLRPR